MSSTPHKPIRGRGRGLVFKSKPKPCNVRKEDIVSCPQSFINATIDEPNHVLSQKPTFTTQSSVDDLSEKIARGILATQNGVNKKEVVLIDLTDDTSSNNTSASESWVDSIDEMEDNLPAINEIHNNETCSVELEIKTADTDSLRHHQNTCDKDIPIISDERSRLTDTPVFDEKPKDLCDSFDQLKLSDNNSVSDEKKSTSTVSDEIFFTNAHVTSTSDHTDVLLKAVHVKEFIPSSYIIPEDERCSFDIVEPWTEEQPFQDINEDHIVMTVLNDRLLAFRENPGDFDNSIESLTEHLTNFVTQESTLKQVVDTIIDQAITVPHFGFIAGRLSQHLDEQKTLAVESGMTFRKVFFKRCQDEYKAVTELCKDEKSCIDNKEKIYQTCILFGELLCTMKIKGKVIIVYKDTVSKFISMFLDIGVKENIVTLTKLLKLVGPELDKGRPKDIEALFDKVKDFYLDNDKSGNLPKEVKKDLWDVYKLHSRDWDRTTSPGTPPLPGKGEQDFFVLPDHPVIKRHFSRQKSSDSTRSCDSPVDWEEFYGGDDADLYKNYMDMSSVADDEYDAYEEFLRISGQLDS